MIFTIVCRQAEQPYRFYSNYGDAIKAGEQQRGWFPGWIPTAADSIHLQNDIDTQEYWLSFRLPTESAESLKRLLKKADVEHIPTTSPVKASWWFEGLIQQQAYNDNALYADIFTGTGEPVPVTTAIAFDEVSSKVYVWSVDISSEIHARKTTASNTLKKVKVKR
jgi:hypothetical protein